MFFLLDKVFYDNEQTYDYYVVPDRKLSVPDTPTSFPTALQFLESLLGGPSVEGTPGLNREISQLEKSDPSIDDLAAELFAEIVGLDSLTETKNSSFGAGEANNVIDETLTIEAEAEKEEEKSEDSVAEKSSNEDSAIFIESDDSEEDGHELDFCSYCGKQGVPMSEVRNAQGGLLCYPHGSDYQFDFAMNPERAKECYINKYTRHNGQIIQVVKRRPRFFAAKREKIRIAKKPKKVAAFTLSHSAAPKGICCHCGASENISSTTGPDGGTLCHKHDNEYQFIKSYKGLEEADYLYYKRAANYRKKNEPASTEPASTVFRSVDITKFSNS